MNPDSIYAQITAKLKEMLSTITKSNGYEYDIDIVEEERNYFEMNNRWNFLLICHEEPVEVSHLYIRELTYTIWFFSNHDDELTGNAAADLNSEIAYYNRNILADVAKCLNTDIYLGGLAQNIEVFPGTNGEYVKNDAALFGTYCDVRVVTDIDVHDQYAMR